MAAVTKVFRFYSDIDHEMPHITEYERLLCLFLFSALKLLVTEVNALVAIEIQVLSRLINSLV